MDGQCQLISARRNTAILELQRTNHNRKWNAAQEYQNNKPSGIATGTSTKDPQRTSWTHKVFVSSLINSVLVKHTGGPHTEVEVMPIMPEVC